MSFLLVTPRSRQTRPAPVARTLTPTVTQSVISVAPSLVSQQDGSNGTELGSLNVIYGNEEAIVGGGKPILLS